MSHDDSSVDTDKSSELQDIFDQLDDLEDSVSSSDERQDVRQVRRTFERLPGTKRIKKYTTRDIAEGFVGGIIFALPLLVEDGVFDIAGWFTEVLVGPVPILLLINILFIVTLTTGLLYFTDIRSVQVRLLFGFIPKRLTGVLLISLLVAAGTMLLWGRLHDGSPTTFEQFARITVIWAAAALGAALGDILPGESQGQDLATMISEIGDGNPTTDHSELDAADTEQTQ